MVAADDPMDRHKVAACYMYAVLAASPLVISDDDSGAAYGKELLNEKLAVRVGCDILSSFLIEACRAVNNTDLEQRIRNVGVMCNSGTGHGSYKESVLVCLYYTRREQSFNILMLALLLFHWEKDSFREEEYKIITNHYRQAFG